MTRRFELHRDRDTSGVSGVGVVAEGVQFRQAAVYTFPDGVAQRMPAGWCRLVWVTTPSSVALYQSVDDVVTIHGHNGVTRLVWID